MTNFPRNDIILTLVGSVVFYLLVLNEHFSRTSYGGGFLIIFLVMLAGIAFLVTVIRGILKRQQYGIHAFIPALIMALPMIILVPCQGTSCLQSGILWLDFIYHREAREEVIQLIRTGTLAPDSSEFPYVIIVPKKFGNLSGNGNRVTFTWGPGETLSVAFYMSDREFDIYTRSFYYTDIPSEVATYEKLAREHRKYGYFRVKKYADHWYTSEAKHGYAKY